MTAICRSCKSPVLWVVTSAGESMPLDPDPVDGGNIILTGRTRRTKRGGMAPEVKYAADGALFVTDPVYVSHFATCPQADEHRKR